MDPEELFWDLAEPLQEQPGVEEGTMMGHRCLRSYGAFAAMVDRRSGGLILKLTEARVGELIREEVGEAFAPAGKVFREWVLVPSKHTDRWPSLLHEATT